MRLPRLGLALAPSGQAKGRRLAEPRVARSLDARPALDSVQSRTPMTSERMIGGVYWNSGAISTSAPARRANPTPARGRSPPAAAAAERPFDLARVGDATPLGDGGALDVDARADQPSNGVLS
jgi:hypothetical protein